MWRAWLSRFGAALRPGLAPNSSVQIGGDALGNVVVTGDRNRVQILQQYPALRDFLVDFEPVFQSSAGLVGRREVFQALASFQQAHRRGYFLISAQAGLGKTALAAEIARRYQAPAFFCSQSRGLTGTARCLNHLSAELIGRYRLKHGHLPHEAGQDSAFFSQLLAEALTGRGGPPWIVIDALDEAEPRLPGGNPLRLPTDLPDGAYLLLTHRPGDYLPRTEPTTPVETFAIEADSAMQRQDLAAYLQQRVAAEPIAAALAAGRPVVSPAALVAALSEKSQGNFMYLNFVLADLAAGRAGYAPLDLAALPSGLPGYYQQFWSQMEAVGNAAGWAAWDGLYRPLAALLAAAGEPVGEAWLADLLGRPAREVRERVLERWERFLSREPRPAGATWRILHQSFADFLAEQDRIDLPAAHRQIADYYQAEAGRWPAHDRYASRHLSAHLRAAGEPERLFALLDDEAWYQAQLAADPSDAAYAADLQQAWLAAETEDAAAAAQDRRAPRLGREVRCALGHASLRSLAANLPPLLLEGLVVSRQWTPRQALAAANQSLNPLNRAAGLVRVALLLEAPERGPALRQALEATLAWEVYAERPGPRLLARLAPHLPPELLAEALRVVRLIQTPLLLAQGLSALLPALAGTARRQALDEALAAAREIGRPWPRATLLARLARWCAAAERERLAQEAREALESGGQPDFAWTRRRLLAVQHGDDPAVRAELLRAVKQPPDGDPSSQPRWAARVLRELAPNLTDQERAWLVERQPAAADQYGAGLNEQDWLGLLGRLDLLGPPLEAGLAERARQAAERIDHLGTRARVLAALAPSLPEPARATALGAALRASRSIGGSPELAAARQVLLTAPTGRGERTTDGDRPFADAGQLGPIEAAAWLVRALWSDLPSESPLRAVLNLEPDQAGDEALAEEWWAVGPGLSERLLEQALQVAGSGYGVNRAACLTALAPYLTERLFEWAFELAVVALDQGKDEIPGYDRARGLAALAPYLPASLLSEALAATTEIDYAVFRGWALEPLAERLAALPPSRLHPHWQAALRRLAQRNRPELLEDLQSLRPVLEALGGEEALQETVEALSWAGEWWP